MLEQDPATNGQRMQLAVLFCDVCDYTSYAELADPEDVNALKRRLERLAAEVIEKHRGGITQLWGDGLLAVFGLPVPTEDDSRRAIEAALEIHERARELPPQTTEGATFEVRMHSGVHAGLVFVRIGDTLRGQYDVTGDPVNTAARLAAAAGRDQVLVSADAISGAAAFFRTEPRLELRLKGKRNPVLVYQVTTRSGVRTRFEARMQAGLTPFVGRSAELGWLLEQLAESQRGQGRVTVLSGAPGIGKTRMLEEFRAQAAASGVLVLSGSCDGYGEVPVLEPFLQTLRHVFGIQRSDGAPQAIAALERGLAEYRLEAHSAVFMSLLALRKDPAGPAPLPVALLATFRAIGELIDRLSERFSIALLLDDWQWADPMSQHVLVRVARYIAKRRVCIVIGTRESNAVDARVRATRTVNLEPFSIEESRQVISRLRASELDVGFTSALHERAGGSPLYLEELVSSLSGDLQGEQSLARLGIPNTLRGLIQARTARLPAGPMKTLQRASVIGVEFSIGMLIAAEDEGRTEADLACLLDEGLIHPVHEHDVFRFKHGITREVVYDSVRIHERRRIHQEIAHAIEQKVAAGEPDQSEALAFHFQGSGDHARAATYAERAGDKAAASSFLEAARRYYEAAQTALDQQPLDTAGKQRWLRVVAKWATQCAFAPIRSQLRILERAELLACEIRDERARAHNSHMLGWFHYVFGNYVEALTHVQRAAELAEKVRDHRLQVQLWTSLGQVYSVSGRNEEALEHLNRGISLKRERASRVPGTRDSVTASSGPAVLYAHALTCRAMVHADVGDFEAAESDIQEALSIVTGTSHAMEPSVLSHHSIVLARQGEWLRCLETAKRACRLAERLKSSFVFGISSALASYAEWRLGASADALLRLRTAVDWLEAHEFGLYLSFAYGCLAEALCESGELERARDYAQRALARAHHADPQGQVVAYHVLACSAWRQRADSPEIDSALDAAWQLALVRGSRRELAVTSLCCARLGRSAPSLAREQLVGAFMEMKMAWYAEEARRVLGVPET